MAISRSLLARLLQGAAIGLGGALLALLLWLSGILEVFEARTWDWRARLLARPGKATDEIAIILLDQNSLDWGAKENGLSWPWPREVLTYLISFCQRAGAKSVAFDVLYLEPSKYGVSDDEAFGAAAAEYGRLVSTLFLGEETGNTSGWPLHVSSPTLAIQGLEDWLKRSRPQSLSFPRASFPVDELSRSARLLANVSLSPDGDGVFRRAPAFTLFDGRAVPSLALAAYMAAQSGPPGLRIEPGRFFAGGLAVPVDGQGNAILRFRGPSGTHLTVSAAAVIQSEIRIRAGEKPSFDPENFRDRYVFFGYSAPGLLDLRPSPVAGTYSGVEIHATMLDNLLSQDFPRSPPLALFLALMILISALAGAAASLASGVARNGLVYLLSLPLPPALSLGAYAAGFWLPLVPLELSLVATLAGAGLVNYATEGRQKRFLKNAFRQYLSPEVIEELIAHPERLKLGGERRELSIFFSDLQGFTGISELLSPEDLTSLLNDYLSAMTDIIQEEGGTVDKYEGDAIIAFWNAPVSQADHAVRAVRSALRCQARLAELRPAFRSRVGKDLLMRIGLNSGPAVVGNMGSHSRFDYTMLGDAVNLASRLEGINKQFRTYIMISQACLDRLEGAYPARELSRVAVVGRKEPVTVYEPMLAQEHALRKQDLEIFASGLQGFYSGDFSQAVSWFEKIAERDPPAAAYMEQCRRLLSEPPPDWRGVWVMTSK